MSDAGKPRTGILLVNLGTPDAPTAPAVRRFLGEFLADVRVIDLPRWLWLPILYCLVLVFRPARVARNYQKIWSKKGSPLLVETDAIAEGVRRESAGTPVAVGMRYGKPSLSDGIRKLQAEGADSIIALPLYPQFSHTTTSSTLDGLQAALGGSDTSWKMIQDYHEDPRYIAALAGSIRRWREANPGGECLLLSFHGIPKRYVENGDPYADQCRRSAELLAAELGLADDQWRLCFQSRFGKAEWLRPYTDELLQELAADGLKYVDVICPGFPADCLETLEEVAIGFDEEFREAGGQAMRYIPALNEDPAHVQFLAELAAEQTVS